MESSSVMYFIGEIMENINNQKKVRDSNLELFRIVVMFLIVAHHYFVNSGLLTLAETELNIKSLFLHFWGMWGHIGTNGFVLITGYFMCSSKISLKKFLKLFIEIEFYNIIIYVFFVIIGKEFFSIRHFLYIIAPIHLINTNFTECYLVFFLFIPFLNILVNNLSRKEHALLIALCIFIFSICAKIPGLQVKSNYVVWFSIIYVIGSYIRKYPYKMNDSGYWLICMICSTLLACASIILFLYLRSRGGSYPGFTLLMAAEAPFAVLVSVCTFMYFKSIKIRPNNLINTIGACTFGVLLIHANSETMRQWLWHDVFRNTNFYSTDLIYIHAILVPVIVFICCSFIEYVRNKTIEQPLILAMYKLIQKSKDNLLTRFKQ